MRPRLAAVALSACVLVGARPAPAQDLPGGGAFTLRTSIKASTLVSHERAASECPCRPVEASTGGTGFWRVRFDAGLRAGDAVTVAAAYEQRLRVYSQDVLGGGLAILPPEAPAPYRVRQLDWEIAQSAGLAWRHEIDRLSVTAHLPRAELTLGRQAVGWGRGVLFGAIDLFSPFTPLEADREWRRGVDAVRADLRLADRVSLDGVAAFGEDLDHSAFAARLRGYAGAADAELAGGWRARDLFGGVTSSAAVGDAEVHGELAVFAVPEPLPTSGARTVAKAVVGGSYRFPVGNGLLVYAEYHYSGFGVRRAADIVPMLLDPDFRERYLRGDMQILGRHAVAVLGTEEFSPELTGSIQWLHAPTDGSGIVVPGATVTLGDRLSIVGMVYLPYGAAPLDGMPRSEYGTTPLSGFVQIRIYG